MKNSTSESKASAREITFEKLTFEKLTGKLVDNEFVIADEFTCQF